MRWRCLAGAVAGTLLLLGCGGGADRSDPSADGPAASPRPSAGSSSTSRATAPPPRRSGKPPTSRPRIRPPDPRWVFYSDDRRPRSSPWFAGRHPVMIPFGCTPAPYYDPDPACTGGQGFHHGIDVAMPCGTPLRAGRRAEVLDGSGLGSAYGADPVLLRVEGYDVVVGHTSRVFARPGQRLARGERFALAGDSGAPDGCHLHFEVRPAGGGYLDAVDPAGLLDLS